MRTSDLGDTAAPASTMRVDASIEHLLLLTLTGTPDAAGTAALRDELEADIGHVAFIVVDLQGLGECRPEVAAVLVGAATRARAAGQDLVIVPGPPAIQAALTSADPDRRLRFTEIP